MRAWCLSLCLCLCLCLALAASAHGDVADISRLESVLADFDHQDLLFDQYVHDADGQLVEFASGRFVMARPRFRWMVDDPYPQVIVSNGEWLKIYDADLEQVTEKSLTDALTGTPLGILSQPRGSLAGEFDVLSHDAASGATGDEYFLLAPVAAEVKAQRVEIWLHDARLKRLDVTDEFGGRLRIEFKPAAGLSPLANPFELVVPEGTEVIRG
ncbi:MAG: outer-membrane lipoprotein carrier protein LolA [Pseudomonadales bacterium]